MQSKSMSKDEISDRINSAMRRIDKKHFEDGIMRRNKLMIEHVIHERMQSRLKYTKS
jgi:fibronectin type 3 domain-containing protein